MTKLSKDTILKIKALYDEGKNYTQIGKILELDRNKISKCLKDNFGIVQKRLVKQIYFDKFKELWDEGKSDLEIAQYFGVKESSIKTYRTKGENAGKFTRINSFSREEHNLSELQDQFIRGSLLGDLSLSAPNYKGALNSKLAIVHSEKQEELFMSKVKILGDFMGNYKLQIPAPDKRTGKVYKTWRGNSKSHPVFTKIYNELYINGTKKITEKFLGTITHPIALAYWFMDDGTYRGTLATHCFSLEENKLLMNWMGDFWGIECTIQKELDKYKLYIISESRLKFEKLIFPYMTPSMYYKLKFKDNLAQSV